MRRTLTAGLVALALALAACGGDDDDAAGPTTTTVEPVATTAAATAAASPTSASPGGEAAFRQAAGERLDFHDPTALDDTTSLALAVCDSLDTVSPEALAADDAANDSAASDAAISEVVSAAAMRSVTDALGPDVANVVLELTVEHLCPAHAEVIDAYVAAQG